MANINELKARASVIKKELQEGRNTAVRVGGLLCDMLDYDDKNDRAFKSDITDLQELYVALTQSDLIITDTLPAEGQPNVIYRVPDTEHTPSQYYSDYMYSPTDLTTPVPMATYNNAIDAKPAYDSQNIVASGGVHNALMEYSHTLTIDDIGTGPADVYKTIKRFEGKFKAGQKCIVRLVGGGYEGTDMGLVIRDPLGNNLATILSGYFDNHIAECCLTSDVDYLEVATHSQGITDVWGDVYACVTNVDKSYSDSSLFLETPLECYADCIKELYLKDLDPAQDYYLYIRRVSNNVYVQITESLISIPEPEDLVAQASFVSTNPTTIIATFEPRNSSVISGTCVLIRESIEGVGDNPFLTHGHKIKNSVVSNLNNFPICTLFGDEVSMYFEGLQSNQDYYLRCVVAGSAGIRYIQLSTAVPVESGNLVAQGIVTEAGAQQLSPMNSSGISGSVYLSEITDIAPFKIDNETASSGDSWRVQTMLLWGAVNKKYTVRKDSVNPGSELLDGILEAVQTSNSVVYVEEGTYDLIDEFKKKYGNDFVTNYTIGTSPYGIVLKNGVHVVFSPKAKVVATLPDYVFGESSHIKDARTDFSPFNSGAGGFTLEGLTLETTNCRYCVHDDRGNRKDGTEGTDFYTNRYINCNMTLDNRHSRVNKTPTEEEPEDWQYGYTQAIGGGFGTNGVIEIKNCVFMSYKTNPQISGDTFPVVSWHNSIVSDTSAKSKIYLTDNYFKSKGYFRFEAKGDSEQKSELIATGNSFGAGIVEKHSNPDNIEVTEWNNIVRQ